MLERKNISRILIAILLLAGFLRLYAVWRGDAISDEVLISFRAIKMIDFDEGDFQTTPVEWFDSATTTLPWWTGLSFHDHPPLVFLVQHLSMRIFGENNLGFRLPSAIFGVVSVYLLFKIGLLIFGETTGLISALILAATVNHVYVSRIGLQESYVIFFILLTLYYFLLADKKDRYFLHSGVALGFGLLAKYTVGIVIPIIFTYTLLCRRNYFTTKKFWLAGLLTIVIFSPVIIYNIEMYRATGHFDFQISYIVGDPPAIWPVQPGKDIGTLGERFAEYIPNLISTNSWTLLSLFALSILAFTVRFLVKLRNGGEAITDGMKFYLIFAVWLALLMLKIGPQYRFLTMITPFIVLGTGAFVAQIYKTLETPRASHRTMWSLAFTVLIIFEIFYSWNSVISFYPEGQTPLLWSKLRYENYNWGYNDLGKFLDGELAGRVPAITFDPKYNFLTEIRDEVINSGVKNSLEPYPVFFVYHGNLDHAGKLWTLDRRQIFHAWPVLSMQTYLNIINERGETYFKDSGFKRYYFIFITNTVPVEQDTELMQGAQKIPIHNQRGDEVFDVYVRDI